MLLRIKALLRRSRIANEHRLHIGKVTLDYDALTVAREGNLEDAAAEGILSSIQAAFLPR